MYNFLTNVFAVILLGGGFITLYIVIKYAGFTVELLIPMFFLVSGFAVLFRKQISASCGRGQQQADERRKAAWEWDPSLRVKYYTLNCYMEVGLPVAKDTVCAVNLDGDTVDIQSSGMSFSVDYSQITDMQVQTKTQVQHFLVSSVGGAAIGDALFGSVGAAIGGRVQHRTIEEDTYYLLVAYLSELEPKYLLFRFIAPADRDRIKKIIEEQRKKMSVETVHIKL